MALKPGLFCRVPSSASHALLCSHANVMDSAKTMTITAAKLSGASGANHCDGGSTYHTQSIACSNKRAAVTRQLIKCNRALSLGPSLHDVRHDLISKHSGNLVLDLPEGNIYTSSKMPVADRKMQ